MRTHGVRAALAAAGWLALASGARASAAGVSEASELDLPVSALAAVAGPAAAVLGRDASALADNPALLGREAGTGVAAAHALRPLGITDSQGSACLSMAGRLAAGLQLRVVRGDLAGASEDGTGGYGGPAGGVDYQALAATAGLAPDLSALTEGWPVRVRAGASLTYHRRDLAGTIQSGWGGSAGATLEWPFAVSGWFVARHFGLTRNGGWPADVSTGAAWTPRGLLLEGDRFTAALGAVWGREPGVGGVVAVEYGVDADTLGIAVRAGWAPATTPSASIWPATGLVLRASDLTLEAGLAPLGNLGWAQVVSVAYQLRPAAD